MQPVEACNKNRPDPFGLTALDGGVAEAEAGFAAEIDAAMQRRIKKESKAQARRR